KDTVTLAPARARVALPERLKPPTVSVAAPVRLRLPLFWIWPDTWTLPKPPGRATVPAKDTVTLAPLRASVALPDRLKPPTTSVAAPVRLRLPLFWISPDTWTLPRPPGRATVPANDTVTLAPVRARVALPDRLKPPTTSVAAPDRLRLPLFWIWPLTWTLPR